MNIKEKPILFASPMVRAIIEGRKRVTRRAVKPQPSNGWEFSGDYGKVTSGHRHAGKFGAFIVRGVGSDHPEIDIIPCPYGQPGDRLWVREAWVADAQVNMVAPRDLSQGEPILYPADGTIRQTGCAMISSGKTRPSIHMPRWASRILLEVTDVRVERLQDGEGETAFESRYLAEGINRIHHGDGEYYYHAVENEPGPGNWVDPFDAWRELWVSVNGGASWDTNPWVWVVEFQRLEVANG